jgi:hypothetical protein
VISPTASSPKVKTDSGAIAAVVLGLGSLIGLILPPLLGAGIAAIVLGWIARRRIVRSGGELKGKWIAIAGTALGVLGSLLSLVIPGFIVSVWIYAAFHGGQLPSGAP